MSPIKRKAPTGAGLGGLLQRRVKARTEPDPESDIEHDDSDEGPSEEDVGSEEGSGSEEDDDAASGSEKDSDAESEGSSDGGVSRARKSAAEAAAQLSFGALLRAQASLDAPGKKKRRGSNESADPDSENEAPTHRKGFKEEFKTAKNSTKPLKRSSKHAPVEMTSKKPVSRKRDFIEVPKVQARDPRFGPLGQGHGYSAPIDEAKLRKAYSFLDDYQEDEMRQLREAIKKTKDPLEKEKLSRALMSMESKKKARERKDKERQLLEEHRKQEKELVKQGKQPFYLKKSEQKKRLLVEQFAGMKKGQVDKAIEKKRKKVAGREKKALPYGRRTGEDRH
ncbi:protein of unknown function (DUF947) domain containing protein [Rhypophila decipiens]